MSQLGQIYALATDPASQFDGAIAQNAQELIDWRPDESIASSPSCRFRLVGISIVAAENLAYDLFLWSRAAGPGASLAADNFLGYWRFSAGDAVQVGGAGSYYYFIFGLDVPYTDDDAGGQIHLGLVPRTAGGKQAAPAGAIKITLYVDPTRGF